MKTIKKYWLLFLAIVFLSSCDSENKPISVSPVSKILKMRPVKITIADWNSPSEVGMTEQLFIKAFNNPENWIVRFETTDVNQINTIMAGLAKPPVEPYRDYMLPMGYKISFEDKKGHVKWTMLYLLPDLLEGKRVISGDRIYGEETYNVFAKILDIKSIQEPNQSSQKPSE